MNRPEVTVENVIVKIYPQEPEGKYLFSKEVYYYTEYARFCPRLIAMNPMTNTLVIERCRPVLDLQDGEKYKEQLWNLLEELHKAGVNHRDMSLKNVVIKEGKPLLIDWENATTEIGEVSADLYGCEKAGVKPQVPDVWWGGPWEHCPGNYWK